MKKWILLISLILIIVIYIIFRGSLIIKGTVPGELLAEPGSRSLITIDVENTGLNFFRIDNITIKGAPVSVQTLEEYTIGPFQSRDIVLKIVVPENATKNVYNSIILLDGIEKPYEIIIGDKEKLVKYRYQQIKDSIEYLKMLGTVKTELISNFEESLKNVNESIEKKDYATADSIMDSIEYEINKITNKTETRTFSFIEVSISLIILGILFLIFLLRKYGIPEIRTPSIKLPKVQKPNFNLRKPESIGNKLQTFPSRKTNPMLQSQKLIESHPIETAKTSSNTSSISSDNSLKSQMLKIVEEQYRAGLISEKTYQELKMRYGG